MTEAIHFGNDFNSSVASLRTLDAFLRNWWCLSIGITGGLRRNTHPIGDRHAECVERATMLFADALGKEAIVSVQNPLRLTNYTEPQPDIVIRKRRREFYRPKGHSPEDTVLLIEVSDTTLRYDRNVKLRRYAAAGILEVWIEDLTNDLLLVYREPAGDRFKTGLTFRRDDSVSPLAFPESIFKVEDLLG